MGTASWTRDEIERDFAECKTLGQVISHLEDLYSRQGEVVCEVRVNGVALTDVEEGTRAAEPVAAVTSLWVVTDKPASLILQALKSMVEFIPLVTDSCLKVATLIRKSDLLTAQDRLKETIDGCQWLVETLLHVRGAASGTKTPVDAVERWFSAESILKKSVEELTEALQQRDFSLVADLLEYELSAALEAWLPVVSDELGKRSESTEMTQRDS